MVHCKLANRTRKRRNELKVLSSHFIKPKDDGGKGRNLGRSIRVKKHLVSQIDQTVKMMLKKNKETPFCFATSCNVSCNIWFQVKMIV